MANVDYTSFYPLLFCRWLFKVEECQLINEFKSTYSSANQRRPLFSLQEACHISYASFLCVISNSLTIHVVRESIRTTGLSLSTEAIERVKIDIKSLMKDEMKAE